MALVITGTAALATGSQAQGAITLDSAGTSTGGRAVAGQAEITFGTDTITIKLTNLTSVENMASPAESLSALDFILSSGSVTDLLSTSGTQIDVDGTGHATLAGTSEPDAPDWGFGMNGAFYRLAFNLDSGGGSADSAILGVTSNGHIPGDYTAANGGLNANGHMPYTYSNGTFVLAAPGMTKKSTATITDWKMYFGTDLGTHVDCPDCGGNTVPEAASLGVLGLGGLLLVPRKARQQD